MLEAWKNSGWITKVWTVGALAVLVIVGFALGSKVNKNSSEKREEATVEKPLEFLYIDLGRVAAYLAQLEGGTFAKKRLSEKVTNSVNGEVSFQSVLKAGGSSEDENFVEREITPTVASSFVTLKEKLEDAVEKGFLRNFHKQAKKVLPNGQLGGNGRLEEGDFVRFRASVHVPIYLAPYLAVHHQATMRALFPIRGRTPKQRSAAKGVRRAAREFEKEVGRNPRFMIDVDPVQRDQDKRDVSYLLPARLRQLNEERSLMSPGGSFTVVGKVARIFTPWTEHGANGGTTAPSYSYVDSLTRELWRAPLESAPKRLICIAIPTCATAIEESSGPADARRRLAKRVHSRIQDFRDQMVKELGRNTEIHGAGAVILPIAIYR